MMSKEGSSSSSSNKRQDQDQLEDTRNILIKIEGLTTGFRIGLPGKDSELDSFVNHVNILLKKQSCVKSEPGEGHTTLGSESGLLNSSEDVAGSVTTVRAELESLKADIKLQVDAFRPVAEVGSDLSYLLKKLDEIIIDTNSPVSSASAAVELIDLEPDLPDSTYFCVKTENDVATGNADSLSNHDVNAVSESAAVELIDLENTDLPDSTYFGIKTESDVATGKAGGFFSHDVNAVSESAAVELIDLEPDLPDSFYFDIKAENDVATGKPGGFFNLDVNAESTSAGESVVVPAATENNIITQTAPPLPKSDEDGEQPPCSCFVPPSSPYSQFMKATSTSNILAPPTSSTRKRQNNSTEVVNPTGTGASKKSKVVSQRGNVAAETENVPSKDGNHIDTGNDVVVENFTFIPDNNVNLVKIEADYNPDLLIIKDENSSDADADSGVEMRDQSSPQQDEQPCEGSSDPEVYDGVRDGAEVHDVALDSPYDQQNGGNIFENNKILTAIFTHLNVQELKNVRLVSKQWKEIADARFILDKSWKLVIDNRFSKRYEGKTLEDLNKCIANSNGSFPLTSLIFGCLTSQGNDGSYSAPSLLHFYNTHGSNITSLELRYFHASVETLHDLLLNRLPKLEDISINSIWFTKKEKLLTSREKELILLPNLKTIFFSLDTNRRNKAHQDYFKAFLTSAVNLKEVRKVQSYMLPCIAQARKLDCVKNLRLWPPNKPNNDLVSFQKFSEMQPKLTVLKINVQTLKSREQVHPYIAGLNKILQSSKDTLKRLQMPSTFFVPGLVLPNLNNLDHLEIYHCLPVSDQEPPAIFTDRLKLGEMFPNVRTVSCILAGIANEVDWIAKYFPVRNNDNGGSSSSPFDMSRSFPSVTHLIFENYHYFGKTLEIYFPMLTHISCYKFDIIYPNENHVGATCGLRETTIAIESLVLWGFRFSGEKSRLDELFTGISRMECVRLNDHTTAPSTTEAGSHLLQNLKRLRRLMIVFDHLDNSKMKPSLPGSETCAVITPVSYLYAFALMENLKEVIFAYDHCLSAASDFAKIFQPFAAFPMVKVVHEPNQTNTM